MKMSLQNVSAGLQGSNSCPMSHSFKTKKPVCCMQLSVSKILACSRFSGAGPFLACYSSSASLRASVSFVIKFVKIHNLRASITT